MVGTEGNLRCLYRKSGNTVSQPTAFRCSNGATSITCSWPEMQWRQSGVYKQVCPVRPLYCSKFFLHWASWEWMQKLPSNTWPRAIAFQSSGSLVIFMASSPYSTMIASHVAGTMLLIVFWATRKSYPRASYDCPVAKWRKVITNQAQGVVSILFFNVGANTL